MKQLRLECLARVKMLGVLGAVAGPVGRTDPILQVYRKLKFGEAEQAKIQVQDLGNGRVFQSWPNEPGFGFKEIYIEDSEATAVLSELAASSNVTVSERDEAWYADLCGQLRAPSVAPEITSKEGKTR